ncbi:acyl-ACP thioesterase domain-containing protein [Nocardia beijingensis]|uniref:acyl-ACP thioesterase domain-containing protein n=1 Tax=Nocardia beijingensis TaxID=95162 RepID=UPI0033188B57
MLQYGALLVDGRNQRDAVVTGANRWSQRPLRSWPPDPALFERNWLVRAGDVDPAGVLRLDAVARYLSDLGVEHLDGFPDGELHPCWLVARTTIEVQKPIRFGERVHLFHWPEAMSSHWFTARIQIRSDAGGVIEAEQFLVCTDAEDRRPVPMTEAFRAALSVHATDHRLRWKPALRAVARGPVAPRSFPLRCTDLAAPGLAGHELAWHGVVEALSCHPDIGRRPHRATVEHREPVWTGDAVALTTWRSESGVHQQLDVDGVVKSLSHVRNSE